MSRPRAAVPSCQAKGAKPRNAAIRRVPSVRVGSDEKVGKKDTNMVVETKQSGVGGPWWTRRARRLGGKA